MLIEKARPPPKKDTGHVTPRDNLVSVVMGVH